MKDPSITHFSSPNDVSKDIYILNPPYTLSNSYGEKTGSS